MWNEESPRNLLEVFRNSSVFTTTICPLSSLPTLKFKFTSEQDPMTKQPIRLEFSRLDFLKVTGDAAKGLFKQAALEKIATMADES